MPDAMKSVSEITQRLPREAGPPDSQLQVLLLTDSDADEGRIRAELRQSRWASVIALDRTADLDRARALALAGYAVIVVDLALKSVDAPDAVDAIAMLHAAAPHSAVVALARFEKEPAITRALRAGASEFVIKGLYGAETLLAILGHALERSRLAVPGHVLADYRTRSRDPETQLPNAELFGDLGRYAAGVAFRSGGQLALCTITVEGAIAETAADPVPPAIAAILREATRETDALARLGRNDYAVMLGPVISPGEVERVMRRIIERLQKVPIADGAHETLKAYVGVAHFPRHSDTYEQLLANAGLATLAARRAGPGSLLFYELNLRGGIG